MNEEATVPGRSGLGRRILLALGIFVVGLGGVLGFFVGANSAGEASISVAFGSIAVPMTPAAMTIYGMALVAAFVGLLYGAVALASRFDTAAR